MNQIMTKAKHHYTRADLLAAIRATGIEAGDTVSLQVSLGRLGLPQGIDADYGKISDFVIDAFLEVLAEQGTLIVPTYTYSIGRGEVFDVENTPASIGEFPEIFRKRPGVVRSRDPMLSAAGIGPNAEAVLRQISHSCYGEGSTFQRLRDVNAKICTLGISLYWATFRHHIEEMANVPFRYRKLFQGFIRENGKTSKESWIYFAAPYLDRCEPVGLSLEIKAREAGLVKVAPVGRGEIMTIGAREYFDFGHAALVQDPWLTAKGPPCTPEELIRLEDERVGARKFEVPLAPGATAMEMIEAVWKLPRDLVSDGYDAALEALSRQVPMTIHEYPTGTECWTWIVPEKWMCRSASLETMDGKALFSMNDHVLHVPSYSYSFQGVVTREELFRHLYVHPVMPDLIPYFYLHYRRDWGLCCSQTTKDSLADEQYRVKIDSALSYGALKVGHVTVPGKSKKSIVICGHLDHPAQVNDGLSGCAVGLEVMRELSKRDSLRYSYHMIIVPETIGSLAFLSHHEHLIPDMQGGFFLEMIGLDYPITMQHSFDEESPFDRCCKAVLQARDPKDFRTGAFLEVVTNDDRQFNAPGVRVPMVSLSRVEKPCGRDATWMFDQYHSEHDTPDMVSLERLIDTREAVLHIIDAWEKNYIPVPNFRGEVFLSRYSIYYDFSVDSDYGQALFEVMHAFDGKQSIVDIALKVRRPFDTVYHITEQFLKAGLVTGALD